MSTMKLTTAASLLLPTALLAGELIWFATSMDRPIDFVESLSWMQPAAAIMPGPETILVPVHEFDYRLSGIFVIDGQEADAGRERRNLATPLQIARNQITEAEYNACVEAAVCQRVSSRWPSNGETRPITGVSYDDATQYAEWLSRQTGKRWRLPTDEEWASAAGSKLHDDAVGTNSTSNNPAARWLDAYAQQNDARKADGPPRPVGFFGANEYGINDFSGNVWEWTDTCYSRTRLTGEGELLSVVDTCAVRVVQGLHRTYISAFIRDAKAGGCSVGAPPSHLGFRLVLELPTGPFGRLKEWAVRGFSAILMQA